MSFFSDPATTTLTLALFIEHLHYRSALLVHTA